MGLRLQSNLLELTDAGNNIKFTTLHRMPHILGQVNGTIVVSDILCVAVGLYYDENGNSYWSNPYACEVSTNHVLAVVPAMREGEVFSQSFFVISAGDNASGGASIVGNGSTLLRIFRNSGGEYAGSMILTCGPAPESSDYIVLQIKSAFSANDFLGYTPIISAGQQVGTLGGSGLIINYRVYYGRFT